MKCHFFHGDLDATFSFEDFRLRNYQNTLSTAIFLLMFLQVPSSVPANLRVISSCTGYLILEKPQALFTSQLFLLGQLILLDLSINGRQNKKSQKSLHVQRK